MLFRSAEWHTERVPVFEDALHLVARFPGRKLYAEIKTGDFQSADLCQKLVLKLQPRPEQLWFIGFNLEVIKHTKRLLPAYPAMHVVHPRIPVLGLTEDEFVSMALESAQELDGIDPCAVPTSVTPRLVDAVRSLPTEPGAPRKTVACWVWKRFPETDMLENWRYLVNVADRKSVV